MPVHLLERFAGNLAPVAPADLGPVQAESSRGSDVAIDRAEQVSRTTAGDERLHDLCERVIAHLSSSPDQSRGDLFAAIPELEPQWNRVITQLKEQGRVSQEGQKRGAKYSLSVADSAPAPIEEITEEPFSSTFLF